jgi:transposase-like protein
MSVKNEKLDKQHRYPWPVIETAVQLHLGQGLTYRSVSEKMEKLGVIVSHKTVYEWVQKFSENVTCKNRRKGFSYSIEEANVTCKGESFILYKALDSKKATVCIYLSKSKNISAAKKAFKQTIEA